MKPRFLLSLLAALLLAGGVHSLAHAQQKNPTFS
jgi:hypothetical protein